MKNGNPNVRRPVRTKLKMIGSYLVKYRLGTGYIHKSESGKSEQRIEFLYW